MTETPKFRTKFTIQESEILFLREILDTILSKRGVNEGLVKIVEKQKAEIETLKKDIADRDVEIQNLIDFKREDQ